MLRRRYREKVAEQANMSLQSKRTAGNICHPQMSINIAPNVGSFNETRWKCARFCGEQTAWVGVTNWVKCTKLQFRSICRVEIMYGTGPCCIIDNRRWLFGSWLASLVIEINAWVRLGKIPRIVRRHCAPQYIQWSKYQDFSTRTDPRSHHFLQVASLRLLAVNIIHSHTGNAAL